MTAQRCATFDLLTIIDLNAPLDLAQYAVYLNKQATPPTPVAPEITEERTIADLVQLIDALNQILQRTNSRVQNPRWIGGN